MAPGPGCRAPRAACTAAFLIPAELDLALAQAAARERISKAQFVGRAIEAALAQRVTDTDPVATIAAINAPTADIEQMLAEIDMRYG